MQPSRWLVSGSSSSVDLGTEEGRAFLQERLAFFGLVGLVVQAGFFVLSRAALGFAVPGLFSAPWSSPSPSMLAFDLLGLSLYLGVWLYARRGMRPRTVVRALDVALAFLTCTLASLPLWQGSPGAAAPFAVLLVVVSVLMARAAIVPSNPGRTLRLGIACVLPLLVLAADVSIPVPLLGDREARIPFLIAGILWSLCAIALSTLTSSVIYGLRRSVSEARRLGQYTLEHQLGEGGMGTVYRARHAMLRRPTAVKLLPPDRAGSSNLARFEREVQLTALLSHPNTVAVYDYGRTPDGIFYYAMEYLEGIDLDALVRCFGPQPPGRVVHVIRQVAGALREAHGVGLIHRDIKPGNVILCERGGVPDVAKVVDFGLVRDIGCDVRASERGLDLVTGTPLYLSPEAITAPERVDARSDLYALGALGFYLLAGRHPFEGATVVEVCTHHLHTPPPRPSQRLGAPLPADLEEVVLACLEKDPARRPQSAAELEERLLACSAKDAWGEREAREWWRGNAGRVSEARAQAQRRGSLPTFSVLFEGRLGGQAGS